MHSSFRKLISYISVLMIIYLLGTTMNVLSAKYDWGLSFKFDTLNTVTTLAVALAMFDVSYTTGKRANEIQAQSNKMQLFDKRYEIYNTLMSFSMVLDGIKSKGYISDREQYISFREKIKNVVRKSSFLFDEKQYDCILEFYRKFEEFDKLAQANIKTECFTSDKGLVESAGVMLKCYDTLIPSESFNKYLKLTEK